MVRKGYAVWLTGLPGSGKTEIAKHLSNELIAAGQSVEILDGDEVRKNLSKDLGFTKEDREAHAMRVAYVAKLLAKHGVAVIVALISPYRDFRQKARETVGEFVEVYVKCSLETCIKRDPKGLYGKALSGKINDLTGLQDPYEEPLTPDVSVDTEKLTPQQSVDEILTRLQELKYY